MLSTTLNHSPNVMCIISYIIIWLLHSRCATMAMMLPKKGRFPHLLHPPDAGPIPTASKALYGIYTRIKYIIDRETKAAWCRMRLCTMHKSRMRPMRLLHNLSIGMLTCQRILNNDHKPPSTRIVGVSPFYKPPQSWSRYSYLVVTKCSFIGIHHYLHREGPLFSGRQ